MPAEKQKLVRNHETGEYEWRDRRSPPPPAKTTVASQPWTSDALGFPVAALAEMEEDRRRNGFSAVEFVEDPQVEGFYRVRIDGRRAREEYIAHRGLCDQSRAGGYRDIGPEQMARVTESACRDSIPVVVPAKAANRH